jgi:hypothetical protein
MEKHSWGDERFKSIRPTRRVVVVKVEVETETEEAVAVVIAIVIVVIAGVIRIPLVLPMLLAPMVPRFVVDALIIKVLVVLVVLVVEDQVDQRALVLAEVRRGSDPNSNFSLVPSPRRKVLVRKRRQVPPAFSGQPNPVTRVLGRSAEKLIRV